MSKPTLIDDERALFYATERSKLGLFNKFLLKFPHLFSHVGVEIRHNRDIPYDNFENNIYVRLIGTEKFCKQATCVSMYPRGQTCTPTTEPLIYQSGNSTIDACQGSCFSFFNGKKDDEGNYYKMPLLRFNNDAECCTIHNMPYFAQATDDYLRTDTHPTPRIDTIGTGFDLLDEGYNNGVDQTFKYKLNKFYCDDFKLEYKDDDCKPSLGEKLFSLFVSENLYKAMQYGERRITTGKGLSDVQELH